jgi:hypothetical protein
MQTTDTYAAEIDDLEKLAAELGTRGLLADVRTPHDRLPYLDVRNPHASALTERVFAQADSYWFSWCERITGCDQTTEAADILARVLRTTDHG